MALILRIAKQEQAGGSHSHGDYYQNNDEDGYYEDYSSWDEYYDDNSGDEYYGEEEWQHVDEWQEDPWQESDPWSQSFDGNASQDAGNVDLSLEQAADESWQDDDADVYYDENSDEYW